MATLFGTDATTLTEPRGAGARPIQGVQTPASPVTLPTGIMDIGVQVVRDVVSREQEQLKSAAEATQRGLLTDFTKARTQIAQSNLSLQEKTARMNALDSQFQIAATEMGVLDDFKKARDLMTSGGVTGEIDTQAKALREDYDRKVTFLRTNNVYVPPNAPETYVETLLEYHAKTETILKDYDNTRRVLEDRQNDTKYSQGQKDRMQEESATVALNQIAGINLESFSTQAQAITDSVLSGEKSEEEARAELTALGTKFLSPINSLAANSPQQATVWRGQYQDTLAAYQEIITTRDSAPGRTIQRNINQAALMAAVRSPEVLEIAALHPYLGENTISSVLASNAIASNNILRLFGSDYQTTRPVGQNLVGSTENKTAETLSYSYLREGLSQIRMGTADPSARDGYFQATNNVLTQLGAKNPGDLEATDLRDIADFMLSSEFAYMVKEGGLNTTAASAASRVFKQVYGEAIDGEIRKALDKELPMIGGSGLGGRSIYPEGVETYIDLVDVKFQDGRAQFVPRAGIEASISQGNAGAINRYIRSSLKEQERALNQNIKLGAHLEGTTNYQKFWEDNKDILMPYMYADPTARIPNQVYQGVEYEYVGPAGGNTKDQNNWRPVNGGRN